MSRRVERTFDHEPEAVKDGQHRQVRQHGQAGAVPRKPRGLQRFVYTYEDIAQLVGKPIRTVKQDATSRKSGKYSYPAKFDPKDLASVLRYVLRSGWPTKERG